jgi:hypothetical protein
MVISRRGGAIYGTPFGSKLSGLLIEAYTGLRNLLNGMAG